MSDTHAACMNFVNALDRLPDIIAQHEERTAKMKADIPVLEGIVAKTWGKEDELKQLKSDLAALDRKIAAELAPKQENPNDGEEIKHDESPAKTTGVPTQSNEGKRLWSQNLSRITVRNTMCRHNDRDLPVCAYDYYGYSNERAAQLGLPAHLNKYRHYFQPITTKYLVM